MVEFAVSSGREMVLVLAADEISALRRAASWKTARRIVAKVEFHFGELFSRVGFIATNLEISSRAVVRFYNKRGTAEQWIKDGTGKRYRTEIVKRYKRSGRNLL